MSGPDCSSALCASRLNSSNLCIEQRQLVLDVHPPPIDASVQTLGPAMGVCCTVLYPPSTHSSCKRMQHVVSFDGAPTGAQVGPGAAPVMEDVPAAPERSGAATMWFNISYERVRASVGRFVIDKLVPLSAAAQPPCGSILSTSGCAPTLKEHLASCDWRSSFLLRMRLLLCAACQPALMLRSPIGGRRPPVRPQHRCAAALFDPQAPGCQRSGGG